MLVTLTAHIDTALLLCIQRVNVTCNPSDRPNVQYFIRVILSVRVC